ncbi:sigma-70 family RNA polymerase sigma factor [Isoptericola hypogeus]|uniref:Sigma-70 family RNA polymerase sigma factor n=1 Tax=Isoptericola hypogeus TaxID=300179 RepID=A0ABP4VR33_9MICO
MDDVADLLARAGAGDDDAFGALCEPYRRELLVHCYRMLGSPEDAEDALQETLVAAWQGLADFEQRASVRTWLYRIATRRCLNALRAARRRPAKAWDVPGVDPPEPTRHGEAVWLRPLPDALLAGAPGEPPGPEARYERRESTSLAFVTALQLLPPRQLAVLVLRDVVGYPAREVAAITGTTVGSVTSALRHARATLRRRAHLHDPPPAPRSAAEAAVVDRFVRAYESADLEALVTLLTDDVVAAMPPMPFEYVGREAVAALFEAIFRAGRRFDLVGTRANGQPAFAAYLRAPGGGGRPATGLIVLGLTAERVGAVTRFDADVLPAFGLPPGLPHAPSAPAP